ncbi:hypothetical protein Vretifemale_15228 [Volvox reticuliferus]|uniref:Carotenoid oxygenase n=3 Tax=Volvox reticuliferus TaxID=1737510 RepID=A0A8J4CNZ3_9CHLO|nr:hypothetical protein Vretifemale_15228 [Volvox reticuliferus]
MKLTKTTATTPIMWSRPYGVCTTLRPTTKQSATAAVHVAQSTTITTTSENDGPTEVRDASGRLLRRGPITEEDIRDYNTLFSSLLKEYAYVVDDSWVTGTIPPEMYGTYYRNGPGLQVDNPRYQRHTLDGDGMVLSLAFRDGRAYFRNRFVRTDGFVKEQAAGRPLFRNAFTRGAADGSPVFNPFDLSFKNVANTGVLLWAGKLYALWEGGLPHVMDPRSLETLGETRMGGALRGSTFGGHYKVIEEADGSRRLVGFSTASGFGGSSITFYEFAEDGSLLHEVVHPLQGVSLAFIHDITVSEHYYIFVLSAMDFDAAKFATSYLLSQCSVAECLAFNPSKPSRVVLVPRPGRPSGRVLQPKVLETTPCFAFHLSNAFEVERDPQPGKQLQRRAAPLVVVDTVAWQEVSFSNSQYTYGPEYYWGRSRSHLVRVVCDPDAGTATSHQLMRRSAEFCVNDPRVNSRQHRITWVCCDMVDNAKAFGNLQAIARLDIDPRVTLRGGAGTDVLSSPQGVSEGVSLDVWYPGDRCFPGEPMFVPRPGSSREGDGWLLVVVHNAATQKAEVNILDAQDLSSGPLATIRLPHRLPSGLHGSWCSEFMGPEDEPVVEVGAGLAATPRWQELGTIRAL